LRFSGSVDETVLKGDDHRKADASDGEVVLVQQLLNDITKFELVGFLGDTSFFGCVAGNDEANGVGIHRGSISDCTVEGAEAHVVGGVGHDGIEERFVVGNVAIVEMLQRREPRVDSNIHGTATCLDDGNRYRNSISLGGSAGIILQCVADIADLCRNERHFRWGDGQSEQVATKDV